MTTIQDAVDGYIASVSSARSQKTAETYGNALRKFLEVLTARNVVPKSTPAGSLSEEAVAWFAAYLKDYTVATESLYLVAVKGFYDYLAAEGLGSPNTLRIKALIRQRSRRTGPRLPQFPREAIEKVIQYAISLASVLTEDELERLRLLRDRAFIITLADTGLRVHEACKLRRADIDMFELRGIVIGKGDKEAVIRFSERAMRAIRDYLSARQPLDGSSGRPMGSLPVFARHNNSSLKKVRSISRITGYAIVTQRVNEALPEGSDIDRSAITPHSFRHYFVTTVLRGSGNLKLAQELARHKNIAVTQRYAHLNDDELDKGYRDIFNEDK